MAQNAEQPCPYCGYAAAASATSCPRCGADLGVAATPPAEAATPPDPVHSMKIMTSSTQDELPRNAAAPLGSGEAATPAGPDPVLSGDSVEEPAITVARVRVALPFVAGAVIAAIVLWQFLGPFSLLLDLALVLWLAGIVLTGEWRMNVEGVLRAGAAVAPTIQQGKIAAPTLVQGAAVMLAPLLAGLLCGFGALVTHADEGEVCAAYSDFRTADTTSSSTFDSGWFDALDNVGKVAEDFGGFNQDTIRASGAAARRVAEGTGSGLIVSASPQEAYNALGPIMVMCSQTEGQPG